MLFNMANRTSPAEIIDFTMLFNMANRINKPKLACCKQGL
jgi:hypothetical protein